MADNNEKDVDETNVNNTNDSAQTSTTVSASNSSSESPASFTQLNKDFEKAVDTDALADSIEIDPKYVTEDIGLTNLQKEENVYFKSDLSDQETFYKKADGSRIDKIDDGGSVEISDGTLTANEDGTVHCDSDYLGQFDYDPELFRYGYKKIREKDGSYSQLPVLEYIGDRDGQWGWDWLSTRISDLSLPQGLRSADYTFANNKTIAFQPRLPDTVTSAHCTYANCPNLEGASHAAKIGEGPVNEGGYVYFPPSLADMSGMYKNCPKLADDFGELPKATRNIKGMWYGCEMMNETEKLFGIVPIHTYSLPSFGKDITPYLSEKYAEGALDDISKESVKDLADETEYYINDEGKIDDSHKVTVEKDLSSGKLDQNAMSESQAATAIEHQNEILEGDVSNEVELESNGARKLNKIKNAATGDFEYDETGLLESDSQEAENKRKWQHVAIDGVTGLVIAGVVGGISKNKLIGLAAGIGGTALLDITDILPETLSPILTATANLLPDGKIKDKLNDWSESLEVSTLDAQKAALTDEVVANAHRGVRLENSLKAAGSANIQDVSLSMKNNGSASASALAFWSAANEGEASASHIKTNITDKCTGAMEEHWENQIAKDGMTPEIKENMKSYYDKLFGALSSYNEGAKDTISNKFGNDSVRGQLSQQGLEMVNRSYMEGVMDSYVRMNDKYQFMTDKELKSMQDKYQIDGVGDLTQYKDSSSFDALRQDAEANVSTIMSMDDMDADSDDYTTDVTGNENQAVCQSDDAQTSQQSQTSGTQTSFLNRVKNNVSSMSAKMSSSGVETRVNTKSANTVLDRDKALAGLSVNVPAASAEKNDVEMSH